MKRKMNTKKSFVYGGVQSANNLTAQLPQQLAQAVPQLQQQQQQQQQQQRSYFGQSAWTSEQVKNDVSLPLPSSEENAPEEEMKQEDITIASIGNGDGDISGDLDDTAGDKSNKKFPFKSIFRNRKKSSVRQKEKKLRQNRQLRKALLPKSALMALYEVKGITISDFNITTCPGGGINAHVTVNGKEYDGVGHTKMGAKNNACEKALRDYIVQKMALKPRIGSTRGAVAGDDEQMQSEENADDDNDNDEVPMTNLASFAIYKLFTEWENEGFFIPELHPASANDQNTPSWKDPSAMKEPKALPIRTELPLNWESMHPCTLLCMMRPGLSYAENAPLGQKPDIVQSISTSTDDARFTGTGRSKKMARRNCAALVCNKLFNTNFVEEQ